MKIKVFQIDDSLIEKELLTAEVMNSKDAEQLLKKIIEDNKIKGLWYNDKPFGFLKSKGFNVGGKIL